MPIPGSTTARRSGLAVALLCFVIIVADGYDMVIYGAALPELLDEPTWQLSKSTAGLIGSWTLGGLMVGFLGAGPLADRFGRRSALLAGIVLFSLGSLISALAPSIAVFGVSRFITGVGIGAVVPSAVALTLEYAPPKRRLLYNGAMLTGFSFGGMLAAFVAMWMLPHFHWRSLFWVAACFIVLLPIMYFRLPESVEYLVRQGRLDEARTLAAQYGREDAVDGALLAQSSAPAAVDRRGGIRSLATASMATRVLVFILISVCVNVMVYGLNTWAPALMRSQGYALGSSLQFLLALQAGSDRCGDRLVLRRSGRPWEGRSGPVHRRGDRARSPDQQDGHRPAPGRDRLRGHRWHRHQYRAVRLRREQLPGERPRFGAGRRHGTRPHRCHARTRARRVDP
ncbi:hypothetical protein MTP03_07130 [Tsukamurella sp. PLM1]|nr:MFS transporter [Tsukamurella sp. PLM1]BDH55774.1 hypothetical protein MTP03_07130 [Tsukamurella sp. PLM1]